MFSEWRSYEILPIFRCNPRDPENSISLFDFPTRGDFKKAKASCFTSSYLSSGLSKEYPWILCQHRRREINASSCSYARFVLGLTRRLRLPTIIQRLCNIVQRMRTRVRFLINIQKLDVSRALIRVTSNARGPRSARTLNMHVQK